MIVIDKGLDGFFHSLIPAKLRETLSVNSAVYIRVRALSAMMVTMNILAVVASLVMVIKHVLVEPAMLVHDLMSLGIIVVFSLQMLFFYRFTNYWLSSLAFTNIYFLIVVIIEILTGGFKSPMLMLLLTCPIVSFVVGGVQEGIQNAVFTAIIGIAFAVLQMIDFGLVDIFQDENFYLRFAVGWLTTLAIIVSCVMVYDAELQKRG